MPFAVVIITFPHLIFGTWCWVLGEVWREGGMEVGGGSDWVTRTHCGHCQEWEERGSGDVGEGSVWGRGKRVTGGSGWGGRVLKGEGGAIEEDVLTGALVIPSHGQRLCNYPRFRC